MEPKLKRKEFKNQKKTLIIVSILVISLFIGGSFALLSNKSETGEVVSFQGQWEKFYGKMTILTAMIKKDYNIER